MRSRTILLPATLLLLPVPYVAEQWARAEVGDAIGGLGSIAIDVGGVHLREVSKMSRGLLVTAEAIEVRPTWNGIEVHVEGLAIDRVQTPEAADPVERGEPVVGREPPPPTIDTKGIPVRVVALGSHVIDHRGVELQVHDPVLEIAADGSVRAAFDADVRRDEAWATSVDRLHATPLSSFGEWSVDGRVRVADGEVLAMTATVSRAAIDFELVDDQGGSLRMAAQLPKRKASLTASAFRPAVLGELAAGRVAGVRWDLREAAFEGSVSVSRDDGWRVDVPTLFVAGAIVEHPALARDPVAIGSLLVTGHAAVRDASLEGAIDIEHDGVSLHVEGQRDATSLDVSARMPATACQSLVDAVPDGMAGALRGSRIEGEIAGALDLQVRFAELPDWEQRLALDPEDPGPPPGRLAIDFPFLEQCRVVGDPGDIDFAGLRGPYRHEFIDGTGRRRSRVMAPGADGFVPLWRVPLLAGAFVTLEDTHFRSHDGFDRAQLGNALWHNFRVGGISRGASTISQQTARNLFLGVDRSIGRKLQEALLTARLEAELPKSRILELYLNLIELGPGVHGVEEAAQYHFGKSAWQLDVVQSIHLAMLAPAPHRYSERWKHGQVDDAWAQEIRDHAKRLWFHGVITEEEMMIAQWDDLDLVPR
jgi:hypothetical protein